MLWLDGVPTFTSYFWLFDALRSEDLLEKACSVLRALECFFQAFSDFVPSILLDFRHHTCGFVRDL